MSNSIFVSGADLFNGWREAVLTGPPPTIWPIGAPFGQINIGPGGILLIGGPPGAGKTALIMQCVFDMLALNPELRAAVANVEMPASRLLDRQLARLSGVPLGHILSRQYDPIDRSRLPQGFERIRAVADRIAFVQGPYDLARVADVADAFESDLLVFDYLQRFDVAGRHNGLREKTNAQMSILRQFASSGVGIIAAAALTRSKDSAGRSSYAGKHLGMASFRESSELEYGCDEAFLLFADETDDDPHEDMSIQNMTLAHVKSRDGELTSRSLRFHKRVQRFTAAGCAAPPLSVAATVNQVWQQPAAGMSACEDLLEEQHDDQQGDEAE